MRSIYHTASMRPRRCHRGNPVFCSKRHQAGLGWRGAGDHLKDSQNLWSPRSRGAGRE
jgi:hypothetical protein